MEETLRQPARPPVRFTLTKKIGLLLLMSLFGTLLSIAFFAGFMEETKTDGHFVNVAGRQRMLSAELQAWAHMVAMGREEDRAGLQTRIAEFEKSLSTMERGGEVMNGLLVAIPAELRGELAAVDKRWRALKPDLVDVAVRPRGEPQFQEAYRRVESGTAELQKLSHQLVMRFEERAQRLRRRMLYMLGSIAGLAGIVFLAGIFLARRYIVQPIFRVDEAARRIGAGDFSQRLEIATRDELSSLANTFNQMVVQTERLLSALNLRRRHAETIIASVPAGILILRGDLAVLSANRSFRETFGVDEQVIARHPMVTEMLPVSGLKEAALEVLSTGEAKRNLLMEMPAKDGSRRLLRITLTGTRLAEEEEEEARLLVIVEDMTEEEAQRAAALESQAHLRLLETCIARLNDMVVITDAGPMDESGPRILFVNDAYVRRTGYSREEVLGKALGMLQGTKTQRSERDRIRAALRKWQPVRAELINYTKSGEEFWNELEIVPVSDSKGRFTHWVSVERDITQRKLAEQALIDSEQRYAALFEAAPVPMWVFDMGTKRFLTVNNATLESYGYSAEEFLSRTVFDIRSEAEQACLHKYFAQPVLAHKQSWQHFRKDGSSFPVDVISQPIQYAGRAARFVVALDMTAQVKAEKDVQDYLFTLQRAADATQAITRHRTLEATLQEAVEQARAVVGAHQAVVSLAISGGPARTINAVSHSDKYAHCRDLVRLSHDCGLYSAVCESNSPMRLTPAELEAHPRWPGVGEEAGNHPPMRGWLAVPLTGHSGENIGLLQLSDKYDGEFTLQDQYVSVELAQLASIAIENAKLFEQVHQLNQELEQKVAERTAALARQVALFHALADQAPQAVWTKDPNGVLTYFNRAWCALVGGTLEDWTGSTQWHAAVHPEDLPEVKARWEAALTSRSEYAGIRRLRSKDGNYHTMSYRVSPVLDDQGEVVFWVGIDADITEIKAIEAALRLSNQELEAFSYSVSHDLRSPLNTVDGFSRLLAKQLDVGAPNEKSQHYLARIQAGVAQMGQLIEDLLSLAQVSRMQLRHEVVDLSALAREIADECRGRNPERVASIHIEEGLQVHGDGRLVRVVMENLVGNAWKFSSRQSRADIRVGRTTDAAGLPVFFVQDNGAGFDMAYADKLFNTFQRLHAVTEFPGTGVGLATVRRVIGRHGGRVWAQSEPGKGATFFFTLPGAVLTL